MTRIKLCGLTREEDIATANELQPDYVGFVFWPRSRRCVSPETARLLKAQLDARIAAVGVFVDAPANQVAGLLDDGTIDIAQLHGHEDDAYISAVRRLLPEPAQKVLVKAFVVKDAA
ncbi:MAG: phosphoribosylanthranilate isomerase, partial [Eggerthellaceae bacterium]|nr:phosphoribosylanthranilate isomerase [Eggerthellaceae bacterium]